MKEVRNRLAILMAEKEIRSVSELKRMLDSKGTSIARRTLDRFYHNENNQIHYETIADLCEILEVDIGELFVLVEREEERED